LTRGLENATEGQRTCRQRPRGRCSGCRKARAERLRSRRPFTSVRGTGPRTRDVRRPLPGNKACGTPKTFDPAGAVRVPGRTHQTRRAVYVASRLVDVSAEPGCTNWAGRG